MSPQLQIKEAFEEAVKGKRFSELKLFERLKQSNCLRLLSGGSNLSQKEIDEIQRRLVRTSFLIELANENATSTKYDVRWSNRLNDNDPRKAEFNVCLKIYKLLCSEVESKIKEDSFLSELKLALEFGLSPHEFPVDYKSSKMNKIHTVNNLEILQHAGYSRLLKIRRSLLNPKLAPDHELFRKLFQKIIVKSYLTDRALTGNFKTNREKRWETDPRSPQFAFRRDCFLVELELVEQLLCFKNFPSQIICHLNREGIPTSTDKVARCPVTLEPLDFKKLAGEVIKPVHGKSAYQVAHLNPLKAGESEEFRHQKENISWITADGNRIQGHLSLEETRKLLLRIFENYKASPKT